MESKFDYETVLEYCVVQVDAVERFKEGSKKSISNFSEDFENFKKLKLDWKKLHNNHLEYILKLKEHIGNGINGKKEISIINTETEELFQDFIQLKMELEQMMNKFNVNMMEMNEQKKKKLGQFDETEITSLIKKTEELLRTFTTSKCHFVDRSEKIDTFYKEPVEHEPINHILLPFINELRLGNKQNISDDNFCEKDKNIAFLMDAYKKNMNSLEALG